MTAQLAKALVVMVPASLLVAGSAISLVRAKSVSLLLQLLGALFLMVVGICHVFEAFQLLPNIGWGLQHSLGHYIDLWSAVLGLTLFTVGYLSQALTR